MLVALQVLQGETWAPSGETRETLCVCHRDIVCVLQTVGVLQACVSATETLCGVYVAQTHLKRLQMKKRVLLKKLKVDGKIQVRSLILMKTS